MHLDAYIALVDNALDTITGGAITSHLDLPDFDYADPWDDGAPPRVAALSALEAAGFRAGGWKA
jgi:hypothetical protein